MSLPPAWHNRLSMRELTHDAFLLDAATRSLNTSDEFGAFLLEQREELRKKNLRGLDAAARYTDFVDAVLQRMLTIAEESVGMARGDLPEGDRLPGERPPGERAAVALLATGGYGRRELAPFSDIDLAFVPAREDDPALDGVVRSFYRLVMDAFVRRAKMKVGYSYRLISDCGALELQTQTSLIDARFVAGDYTLFTDFRDELRRQIQPARFVFDKMWERSAARDAAGGTIYRVEPDLKNGAGGLREIQTAVWLAQVRFGIWSPGVWDELIDRDVVSYRQVQRLYEALEFLHSLRSVLHWRAGRQNDVLMMAQQADVAEEMGFSGTESLTPSQQLTAAYFRYAERIHSLAERVSAWVLESRLELGDGLSAVRRQIECTSPELFLVRPGNLIRAFLQMQALGIPFSSQLEALLRDAVSGPRSLTPDKECGPLFRRIVDGGDRVFATVRVMALTGVLGWVLPEFAPLMTLAPRDPSHEFTVGYHSLEVLRRLEDYRSQDTGSIAGEAFSHLDTPTTLYLAALLHDAGKALAGRGHSELGASLMPAVGIRLDLQPQQIQSLQWLVSRHLLMSEIARFRDLTREGSLKEFMHEVADQDSLDQLFLLTLADSESVGPGVFSAIQRRFVEELYYRATNALGRPEEETGEFDLRRYQRRVTQALTQHNLNPDEVAHHVELMPASYLLNSSPAIMALHIGMARRVQETRRPVIEFRDDRQDHFTEMTVAAVDLPFPGLLSKIAGALWSHDVSVHSAQVFTRPGDPPVALDTLWVDFHGHTVDPQRKRRLEIDLGALLAGERDVEELLILNGKGPDLGKPLQDPEVSVRRSEGHLICELRANDQRGLLYRLTRAISELGWDIESARISSDGRRTRDVFYIAEREELDAAEAARRLRERLLPQFAAT